MFISLQVGQVPSLQAFGGTSEEIGVFKDLLEFHEILFKQTTMTRTHEMKMKEAEEKLAQLMKRDAKQQVRILSPPSPSPPRQC